MNFSKAKTNLSIYLPIKICVLFLLLACSILSNAQSADSLQVFRGIDSLIKFHADTIQKQIAKADSIVNAFQSKMDSLQQQASSELKKINSAQATLQSKIDSLTNLRLPPKKLKTQLDSLHQLKTNQLSELSTKLNELKAKATGELDKITLPPQLQEPMQKIRSSIQDVSIPSLDLKPGSLPELSLPEISNLKIPNLTDQLALDPNLKEYIGKLNNLSQWTDKADGYVQDISNLSQGKVGEVKHLDKTLENKLSDFEGVDELTKGKALVAEYSQMDSAAIKAKAKELVQQQVMEFAQDHFADKQEVLKKAMDKMTKLKSRYSEVKSVAELPKRLPNPLKSKPFIERLIPGITFQVSKSDNFLLDVNPSLVYHILPRFSAGAGWNHRLTIDGRNVTKEEEIYGPRAIFELKWTRGFVFRFLPELMYTVIPPPLAQLKGVDPTAKKWVPSYFVGIKKEFKVYKTISGNTEMLYNLYDKDGESPYGDRLSIRFGFEFPMKKKVNRN